MTPSNFKSALATLLGGRDVVETAEAAAQVASAGLKGAIAGGGAAFWGGWASNDIAMVGGLLLGALGFVVQVHFKRKEHRLRLAEHQMLRLEHEARMSGLTS